MTEIDFRLPDDSLPMDDASWHAEDALFAPDLAVLAEHHTTPNGLHSFYLASAPAAAAVAQPDRGRSL
ncbi:hypothetical protein P3T35_007566 [Kitasatospora sp. GP30]|uniref:hypothetical protein n=1 Tax=Kitasatospora sp. GP30 TaxID=3035084 RepID=UPI000C710528|nr:hypothetical protein [Kitasatospora sp. GP30]MDH6145511.1 hypothetical protein [Kitasatospora sp. GP30]